jgi:hypothetical protein
MTWAKSAISALVLSMTLAACGGGSSGGTTSTATAAPNFTSASQVSTFVSNVTLPMGIAVDSTGNLYILSGGQTFNILKVSSSGSIINTSLISSASFLSNPLLIDSSGNIYDTTQVQLGIETGHLQQYDSTGNLLSSTNINMDAAGLARDSNNNIYITGASTTSVNYIKKFSNGTLTTVVDSSNPPQGLPTGWAPKGIVVDSTGNIFVVDVGNSQIDKIDTSGNFSVLTLTPQLTSFSGAITVDSSNNLYVLSSGKLISKITSVGAVSTVAGISSSAAGNTNGPVTTATFNFTPVNNLVFDNSGNLYVTETGTSDIRKIAP